MWVARYIGEGCIVEENNKMKQTAEENWGDEIGGKAWKE